MLNSRISDILIVRLINYGCVLLLWILHSLFWFTDDWGCLITHVYIRLKIKGL